MAKSKKHILKEYHHGYNDALMNDAKNICKMAVRYYLQGSKGFDYQLAAFPAQEGEHRLKVRISQRAVSCYIPTEHAIEIPIEKMQNAIKANNFQSLLSIIYHELGHLANYLLSGRNMHQMQKNIKSITLASCSEDFYRNINRILYRFQSREMKARCFETAMYLEQSNNPNITIQEIYDNRCSDLTLMRKFLLYIKSAKSSSPLEQVAVIKELFRDMCIREYSLREYKTYSIEKKAQALYKIFARKFLWLKKRIDKIYYDYISQFR